MRSSAGGGVLDYFFDFDGNGVFGNQPNEIFSATLSGGTQQVNVTIPSNSVTTSTYARFRISQSGGLGPTGLATGGEVEDYAITILASAPSLDFGDAPDPAYATLLANNGPRHVLGASRLGVAIDAEANGLPNATATGDGVDDDGIVFLTPLVPNSNATIQVTSTGGVLNYFVDFDANGVFGNLANEVFSATLAAGTQNVIFAVPASAALGTTRGRFRLSTTGGLGPTGLANDGEVEDYQVLIVEPPTVTTLFENFDGVNPPSLPDNWSATTTASNSWQTSATSSNSTPNSAFVPSITSVSDASLISPAFTATSLNKQFQFSHSFDLEFQTATTTGYDGGVLEISINGGAYQDILLAGGAFIQNGYNFTISSNYASPIGGRSAWSGNSATLTGNQGGYITTIVDLPTAAVGQSARLRWRSVTDSSISNVGWRVDSVQRISRQFTFDYGDAPDPPYPTLSASNGAAHVFGALRLGAALDGEVDGQGNANASGDGADDDGVVFPTPLVGGSSNSFTVQASAPALLSAWLDANGNGSWSDANEQIVKDLPLIGGSNALNLQVPNVATLTNTFMRFRFSTQSGLGAIGSAGNGEVEDYAVSIRPLDTTPPSVLQVKAGSTGWTNEFKSYLDSTTATSNDSRGYSIPTSTSAAQLRPLSWVNMD
ncbi:MAG: hypothetical protein KGQ60_15215, partial [Planctomycetes bacterium]|nr:hypothetical protein [Planctomycetota bacterium]